MGVINYFEQFLKATIIWYKTKNSAFKTNTKTFLQRFFKNVCQNRPYIVLYPVPLIPQKHAR